MLPLMHPYKAREHFPSNVTTVLSQRIHCPVKERVTLQTERGEDERLQDRALDQRAAVRALHSEAVVPPLSLLRRALGHTNSGPEQCPLCLPKHKLQHLFRRGPFCHNATS